MNQPVIVVVAGDPGGVNAVRPVMQTLREHGTVRLSLLGYRQACDLWSQQGWTYHRLSEKMTTEDAENLLAEAQAAFLLTGTSCNDVEVEKHFIAAARRARIPSLAVLDFWSNYSRRFANRDGALAFLPDRIAIMDNLAREEMLNEGFPASVLVVTGQPAFDDLARWTDTFSPAARSAVRQQLGAGPHDLLILFASQPLAEMYGDDPASPDYLGFTEKSVLAMLIEVLDRIARRTPQRIVLAIRPHPREPAGKFADIHGERVAIRLSTTGEARAAALASDLVVGMNTELLVEACYLGCLTLSLQPGLRRPDMLPTNRSRHSWPVYVLEEMEGVIERLLLNAGTQAEMRQRMEQLQTDGCATRRVVDLIYASIYPQGRGL